jgi:SAM-dependent methyltransferase
MKTKHSIIRARKLRNYRAVGSLKNYDLASSMQFNLLTFLGLRERHFLLDIGCGSLRAGKLFIPYLLPGHYFGIEPDQWLIEEGIRNELGETIMSVKKPVFNNDSSFTLSIFNRKFDFLLAHSILVHTPQEQLRRCLSEAKKVMMPTSYFAATFIKGEKNYEGDEWLYGDFATYTLEHMMHLVEEAGLKCILFDWPQPHLHQWIVMTHPENEKNIPDLKDVSKVWKIENELRFYKQRLSRLERNSYVRFGLQMNKWLKSIRGIFRTK